MLPRTDILDTTILYGIWLKQAIERVTDIHNTQNDVNH